MDEFLNSQFIVNFQDIIVPAIFSTLRMLFFSMLFGMIIGMVVAILLVMTSPYGLNPKPKLYKFVSFWVNMIRSFPVIILIVAMSPLTRVIVGTSVGEQAAIVPLTIAAFPVIARYVEASLLEVDRNVILAARSFGATNMQILIKVMFVEAMPAIVSGITTTVILFLASTALAGAVGAGGLGAVALTFGYQKFDDMMMYCIVAILFIMVLLIQGLGELLYRKVKKGKNTQRLQERNI